MLSLYNIFTALGRREFLNFLSDKTYISISYYLKFWKKINLNNPKTFNEKLQWIKLNDRKTLYTILADKYLVKEYVADCIGDEHVIKTLGIWNDAKQINFSKLPNQFVLKCNHDSGSVIICRDKSKLDKELVIKKLNKSLMHSGFWFGREWPYKNIKPQIIAEQYIEDDTKNIGLTDYKFFCFNGVPKLLYVSLGLENHSTAQISFFDMNGKEMPFRRKDYRPLQEELHIPPTFDKMKEIAELLAKKISAPFVRIDLYPVKDKVYFSEVTFFPCNGGMPFNEDGWDTILGSWMKLDDKIIMH